ncbi:hypothetical protein [Cylindrospermum sp. FACHB-282]|uniref:hypothetical protein n=1 Tax=Cylindrospermum sp. FACHB-282 TaxID=2692794 RepID=UPI001685FAF4|nr:hypothetical protein [Cylindrospermum sp. FACHB-282]MBD2388441.1 hypothetical protein [Cylindrospermum sp. FACHB-282]
MASQSDDVAKLYKAIRELSSKVDELTYLVNEHHEDIGIVGQILEPMAQIAARIKKIPLLGNIFK